MGTQTAAVAIPVGQVSASLPNWENIDSGVASFDYDMSSKNSLRARYVFNRAGVLDNTGFPAVFFDVRPANTYLVTASEYHAFTASLTNEFRLGFQPLSRFDPGSRHPNVSWAGRIPEHRHLRTRWRVWAGYRGSAIQHSEHISID